MNCKCTCDYELREATLPTEEIVAKPTRLPKPDEVTTEPTKREQQYADFERRTEQERDILLDRYKVPKTVPQGVRFAVATYQTTPIANQLLRGQLPATAKPLLRQMAERQDEILQNLMKQSVIETPIVVYRSYGFMREGNLEEITKQFDSLNVGDLFHEQGYSSTTLSIDLPDLYTIGKRRGYWFKILVPEGTHGLNLIGNHKVVDRQQEILLDKDTTFSILEIDHASKIGTMTIVPKT
jgi:hypothetical protein